jgi:LPS-assembly lipoprotein
MIIKLLTILPLLTLGGCGFHLRGETQLAPALHSLYIQSIDPYGVLVKELEQSLKMSKVKIAASSAEAESTLVISNDSTAQDLLSVGGTQQTRQYKLSVIVVFYVNDAKGRTILEPQSLTESRVITIQSNQILGSSNEANLYFQQMRRTLASAIMYRLSSRQVTSLINKGTSVSKQPTT